MSLRGEGEGRREFGARDGVVGACTAGSLALIVGGPGRGRLARLLTAHRRYHDETGPAPPSRQSTRSSHRTELGDPLPSPLEFKAASHWVKAACPERSPRGLSALSRRS